MPAPDQHIETIHVYIVREDEAPQPEPDVVESTVQEPETRPPQKPHAQRWHFLLLSLLLFFSLFIPSSAATAALPVVTVTIIPKTQTITTTQRIQVPARLFPPLTLSQSQTTATTGHGHQNATAATGTITLYNGLFTSQTIAAGTIITASTGIPIATDQPAIIPAANPPGLGQTTVFAHAVSSGARGNIPAYSINHLCCTTAVKAVNSDAFSGGQDERDFSTVRPQDINMVAMQLHATLHTGMQAVFTSHLTQQEALIPPLCSETVTPDHYPGAAATTVTVTVSQTCSAGAYQKQTLQEHASHILTATARHQFGAGYRLIGNAHIIITHTTIQTDTATFELTYSGTWVYHFSQAQQQELITLIAGRSKAQAIHFLLSMPGIQGVSITQPLLPTDPGTIQLIVS